MEQERFRHQSLEIVFSELPFRRLMLFQLAAEVIEAELRPAAHDMRVLRPRLNELGEVCFGKKLGRRIDRLEILLAAWRPLDCQCVLVLSARPLIVPMCLPLSPFSGRCPYGTRKPL